MIALAFECIFDVLIFTICSNRIEKLYEDIVDFKQFLNQVAKVLDCKRGEGGKIYNIKDIKGYV